MEFLKEIYIIIKKTKRNLQSKDWAWKNKSERNQASEWRD